MRKCIPIIPKKLNIAIYSKEGKNMDVSFAGFCQQVFSNPVLMVTVVLTLGVIFVNGWTDAPNAIATCIATRCLKVRTAILMSAVFNFLGVLVMTHINSAVASTISNMVDFGGQTEEALQRSLYTTASEVSILTSG